MILAIDVGNTNITIALFQGLDLITSFRLISKKPATSDEYGIKIVSYLRANNFEIEDIENIVYSSVVPRINTSFIPAIKKYLKKDAILVKDLTHPLTLNFPNSSSLGEDRLVTALASYLEYPNQDLLVIDFGTATTFDLVTKDGVFEGGIISCGLETTASALVNQAAKLFDFELALTDKLIAKDGISAMQAGVVNGYLGMCEYFIEQVKKEFGKELKVIATGGLARIIITATNKIDVYDDILTLKGINYLYLLTYDQNNLIEKLKQ